MASPIGDDAAGPSAASRPELVRFEIRIVSPARIVLVTFTSTEDAFEFIPKNIKRPVRSFVMTSMAYDWEGKEKVCYDLYVTQDWSLDQIMAYFRDKEGFIPSKRVFEAQFSVKWQFPSKPKPVPQDSLNERIKELWESNTTQKEMLRILDQEGYKISERELSRLRKKNGYSLRTPNGMKQIAEDDITVFPMFDPSPELKAVRDARQKKLKEDSDERLKNKTRRVRTRNYGSLPADPPMPPRFPSEMTIGQSKEMLQLTQDQYSSMRDRFQVMCEAECIVKKSHDAKKWSQVKESLIEETSYLQTVLRIPVLDDNGRKLIQDRKMALDIICSDVAKKIRTSKTRITIPDAKSRLGVNPAQATEIRLLFYEILIENHFTSKMEAGQQQWDNMKADLKTRSHVLQGILDPAEQDPKRDTKEKALEVICRDVMKRLRDDQTKIVKKSRTSSSSQSLRDGALQKMGRSYESDPFNTTNANYDQSPSNSTGPSITQAFANTNSYLTTSSISHHPNHSSLPIDLAQTTMANPNYNTALVNPHRDDDALQIGSPLASVTNTDYDANPVIHNPINSSLASVANTDYDVNPVIRNPIDSALASVANTDYDANPVIHNSIDSALTSVENTHYDANPGIHHHLDYSKIDPVLMPNSVEIPLSLPQAPCDPATPTTSSVSTRAPPIIPKTPRHQELVPIIRRIEPAFEPAFRPVPTFIPKTPANPGDEIHSYPNFCLADDSPVLEEPIFWQSIFYGSPTKAKLEELALLRGMRETRDGMKVVRVEAWTRNHTNFTSGFAIHRNEDLGGFLYEAGRDDLNFQVWLDYA